MDLESQRIFMIHLEVAPQLEIIKKMTFSDRKETWVFTV